MFTESVFLIIEFFSPVQVVALIGISSVFIITSHFDKLSFAEIKLVLLFIFLGILRSSFIKSKNNTDNEVKELFNLIFSFPNEVKK